MSYIDTSSSIVEAFPAYTYCGIIIKQTRKTTVDINSILASGNNIYNKYFIN
jgi:hypothetical protein